MTERSCRKHGKLLPENIYTGKNRHGNTRYQCKICVKERGQALYLRKREQLLKQNLEYTRKNKDKIKAIRERTRAKNRIKYNEYYKAKYKKETEDLSDNYIKMVLIRFSDLSYRDITQDMIEVKRWALMIKRKIWEIKNEDR